MVRILVLGKSGAAGVGLEDPSRAWPYLLREAVEAETGERVELSIKRFYLIAADPTDYLRKVVDETQPDIVIARVSANDFAMVTVSHKVSSRWGARAARYVAQTERKLRRSWTPGKPGALDALAQRIAHKVIGAEPLLTRAQVVASAEAMFRFFGQREDLTGIMVGCPYFSPWVNSLNPGLDRIVDEFNDEMRAAVKARHLTWVEPTVRLDEDRLRDGMHETASGHRRMVTDILPAVVAAVRERAAAGVV